MDHENDPGDPSRPCSPPGPGGGGQPRRPATLDTIRAARNLLLTTYRRDGTPVLTPVWFVAEGDDLWVVTTADSGKVKRLRADEHVGLATCTRTGRPRSETLSGTALVLDTAEAEVRGRALVARYGWQARVFQWQNRRKRRPMVAIRVTPTLGDRREPNGRRSGATVAHRADPLDPRLQEIA